MLACLDVFYVGSKAWSACVVFDGWRATAAARKLVREFHDVAEYEPGNFFRRELPCLTGVLRELPDTPDVVVIDGYVWLDSAGRPGLGAHLYDALGRAIPVVGVAKSEFEGAPAVKVLRGKSKTPLYVTSAGVDAELAAENIRQMSGEHRIPSLLKLADQLCRAAGTS